MIETVIEIYFINIYILYLRSAFIGSSSRYVGGGLTALHIVRNVLRKRQSAAEIILS